MLEVTGSQGLYQLLCSGLGSLTLPPLLQQLPHHFIQLCGMPPGDGLQLHVIQSQFAAQFTPVPSQLLSDHLCGNVQFG